MITFRQSAGAESQTASSCGVQANRLAEDEEAHWGLIVRDSGEIVEASSGGRRPPLTPRTAAVR
jgi:hypothetical protein